MAGPDTTNDVAVQPLTLKEIADEFGVSVRTVAQFALLGRFGSPDRSGGPVSFSPAAVQEAKVRYAREISDRQTFRNRVAAFARRVRRIDRP